MQWVKLSHGWLNLERVGAIVYNHRPRRLGEYAALANDKTVILALDTADVEYLTAVAVLPTQGPIEVKEDA